MLRAENDHRPIALLAVVDTTLALLVVLDSAFLIYEEGMVLQLAYHISKGIPVCGQAVRKGTVLYLALEDNEKRLQRRMCQMFGAENVDNVYFATKAATISGGLEEQIKDLLNQHTDTSLVIIDTLQKVREYDRGTVVICFIERMEVNGTTIITEIVL